MAIKMHKTSLNPNEKQNHQSKNINSLTSKSVTSWMINQILECWAIIFVCKVSKNKIHPIKILD